MRTTTCLLGESDVRAPAVETVRLNPEFADEEEIEELAALLEGQDGDAPPRWLHSEGDTDALVS